MSDVSSRRDFLFYSGAALAGVTLGQAGRRWLARADSRADAWRPPAAETSAVSVCRECTSGCGVTIRLVDDVPIRIEGNPLCPVSRGRLCARGQAAVESYFDPDRFIGPAHRIARGGPPRWEPLPWKDAIALATDRLRAAASVPDGIVAVAVEERGAVADAWARVWTAASARVAWTAVPTAARLRPSLARLTGAQGDPVFDVARASYILSFGAPLAEDWLSGIWAQRSFGRFRRRPGAGRGRLVQIEARRSPTARKADEWLAVPPDRQAALAYGIASALFRENRIDRDRIEPFAGNIASFERQVITYYTPDNVSAETGVPVVTVLRLARELLSTPQPLVTVDATADPALVDAVFALNVLIGAVDRPGGLFLKPSGEATFAPRAGSAETLRAVVNGEIRPKVLVFADSSGLRELDAPNRPEVLTERVPFIISLSPYVDEAAAIADLVLPTDVAMESWHAVIPPAALAEDVVAVARPAVTRRLDTLDIGSVLKSLAVGMGGPVEEACAWTSSEDLVRDEIKRLGKLRRGTPFVTTYETNWIRQLESGGWWTRATNTDEEFAARVLAAGGWVDPFVESAGLTDSLRTGVGLALPLPEVLSARLPASPTMGDTASRGNGLLPVKLIAFRPSVVNLTGNPNLPVLFELLGQPDSRPWAFWVEVGAELAERIGVDAGARVRVRSAHDAIEAVVVRAPGMPADMAAIALVPGGQTAGRWAGLLAADPRRLWGSDSPARPCAVEITRA